MFTLLDVRRAIGNGAFFARGRSYAQEGRVERVVVEEKQGQSLYRAMVRGSGGIRYGVMFAYDDGRGEFTQCGCDCPAFPCAEFGCKHVAALMITVCEQSDAEDALRRRERLERERREAQARELEAWRAWERHQAEEREQLERERRERFIEQLVTQGQQRRMRTADQGGQAGGVRLYPVLTKMDDAVGLELKIGRTRAYVVRSLSEFARRVEQRERTIYGRELTFSHSEEEVEAQDLPLLWHVVMLADSAAQMRAGCVLLTGTALDQTMRLLLGREVELRMPDGHSARVPVTAGEKKLEVELRHQGQDVLLRVTADNAVVGGSGMYFFGEDGIFCAFGAAFERMHGLVNVAEQFPRGLLLRKEQLGAVCAQVIAPAAEHVTMRSGGRILEAHVPMGMTPRYYIGMDDKGRLTCRVRFAYGETEIAPGEVCPHIRRDDLLEGRALADSAALFPVKLTEEERAFEGSDEACFALLTQKLSALEQSGEVMIDQRLANMNVQTRRNMTFGLSVSGTKLIVRADLGGLNQDELRDAYAAYRQKRKFIRLANGAFLSGDALLQAAETAQMLDSLDVTAEQAEAGAEVPATRGMYLDAALSGRRDVRLRAPKELLDWMERLRAAQKTSIAAPGGLRAELRGYQMTGLSWLCALSDAGFGGILADDMGLGKTIQVLAMLLREQERGEAVRALVVCPASLQLNWLAEAERFAPSLTCRVLTGTAQKRADQIRAGDPPNILIASYDQLRRDAQAYADIELTHVLLDEAQYIKNAASQGAKAAKTLRARHRFAMTGTPIENRLAELWSIFDFLMPGYLFSYKKFKERFELPIVRDGDEQAKGNLRQMVAPFILRRMKQDVLTDLPEKVETLMTSELTAEQQRLYAAYAARLMDEAEGGLADAPDRMRVLAGLTRLRQLCCDPRLCLEDYAGGSGKLDQCVDVVKSALGAGHRILLFSQFTSMLALIREALEAEGVSTFTLTGETDKQERMRMVEAFNAGGAQVFLISLKAGGTGLNLTGADVVIHYDPWWNVSAQNQATDRAHRIGQTRGVQVIRLIAAGTVEERILQLQEQKRALSDGVLLGDENLFTIDTATLREILRGSSGGG